MKAAYAVFMRDKVHQAPFIERQVRAAFAQTYPCEILLSDQGSTDGTRELLHKLAGECDAGHHTVKLLDCPETAVRGMAGLNAHLGWLQDQTDAEIFIHACCDDLAAPERAKVIVEGFERTGADMVGTAMYFEDSSGKKDRTTWTHEGWVSLADMIKYKVGGGAAAGWRRDFWRRISPIPGICSQDVWMPPIACMLGGFYFIDKPLYTYLWHADGNNAGLEGVLLTLEDPAARRVIDEHRFFQTAAAYQWVLRRMTSLKIGSKDDFHWVRDAARAHYEAWLDTRMTMTVNREPPKPFRI